MDSKTIDTQFHSKEAAAGLRNVSLFPITSLDNVSRSRLGYVGAAERSL